LRLLAIINFRLENFDAAWQDFEDLLATGQYTMDAFYYLARIADYRGQQDRAIALYSKVTHGDNAVFSQRRAAGVLAQQKKHDQAQKHLEDFGRRHPSYAVDMLQAQAQLLSSQERYDEALEYFDRVITYRPDSENALLGKAELLLRMGKLDDALDAYRLAVKKWPDSAIVLNALGYTLADRTEEYKEAEKLIRKALKLDPDSAAIIDSYGWVLYRQGDYEKALVELERAYVQLEDPEVAAHIIEVLWHMDRSDEAMERLVEAEERWPESPLLENVRNRVAPNG
jgi:tetratricopeptide (TPR) repeat protein